MNSGDRASDRRPTPAPNFLGIGAHKCGTTWLSEVLRSHPEVFVAHGKEVMFFTDNRARGLGWYRAQFAGAGSAKAVGEFSVNYLERGPEVAERIHALNPEMKLIVSVRDPVDRALSHYRWLQQLGRSELPPFLKAIETEPALAGAGRYFANLEPYWQLFPDAQIHIERFDDIVADPVAVQRRLFRFLCVSEDFVSPRGDRVIGRTIRPRYRWLETLRSSAYRFVKRNDLPSVITLVKNLGASELYRRLNDLPREEVALTPQERRKAYSVFAQDTEKFASRSGVDIRNWRPRE